MRIIKGQSFPNERDLYAANGVHLIDCRFEGEADGESALKEASDIVLENCYMNLRYPLWHDFNVKLFNVEMTENCRAALWYTKGLYIQNSKLLGIKALRECEDIVIENTQILSPEFGWRSHNIQLNNVKIDKSEYLFFEAKNLKLKNVNFVGKYSFQYVVDLEIQNSYLDTKDAFWHSKNVIVRDSVVKGEYLAWYSEGLTLMNCKIIGTQPFCYCKDLKLIHCEMVDTDLAFEYSDVEADIYGDVVSIKNPRSGNIILDTVGEIILTEDSKYKSLCKIEYRKKKVLQA